MQITYGARGCRSPRLSIIVMSINSDPAALLAVRTVEGDDIEKILVNTGAGTFVGQSCLDDVILIEDERKRLPGGTRNLGIEVASAPIIAFLAADCVMPRETIDKRIQAHEAGYHLVSSTLRPYSNSTAAWASYVYIHRNRMPEFQRKLGASLFGVSYTRGVFDKVGTFDDSMRVSEDAEFNSRCRDFEAMLATDIVTYHRYPETLSEVCDDAARRAVREMKFRHRSGIAQARSEFVKSLRLTVLMLLKPNLPVQARKTALLLPIIGIHAARACLRAARR